MLESETPQLQPSWYSAKPVVPFAGAALGMALVLATCAYAAFGTALVPALLFCVIVAVALRGIALNYPHDDPGWCNIVTLLRGALVAFLAGAAAAPDAASGWLLFGVASVALALDGADGWLARRAELASDFGARFDMEIDAALAATLAAVLMVGGTSGPEILILGFTRYLFVAAGSVLPALRSDLPESFRRKTICVVQIAALIILMCPLTPTAWLAPVSVSAAALLLWSFAVDIRWLLRDAA